MFRPQPFPKIFLGKLETVRKTYLRHCGIKNAGNLFVSKRGGCVWKKIYYTKVCSKPYTSFGKFENIGLCAYILRPPNVSQSWVHALHGLTISPTTHHAGATPPRSHQCLIPNSSKSSGLPS